jgi:hypothetical protein
MEGYPVRVDAVFRGRREIDLADVRINDIYVTPDEDHTGLVVRVAPAPTSGTPPTITIRHDSSRQRKVAEDDFARHFRGRGTFYR